MCIYIYIYMCMYICICIYLYTCACIVFSSALGGQLFPDMFQDKDLPALFKTRSSFEKEGVESEPTGLFCARARTHALAHARERASESIS